MGRPSNTNQAQPIISKPSTERRHAPLEILLELVTKVALKSWKHNTYTTQTDSSLNIHPDIHTNLEINKTQKNKKGEQ